MVEAGSGAVGLWTEKLGSSSSKFLKISSGILGGANENLIEQFRDDEQFDGLDMFASMVGGGMARYMPYLEFPNLRLNKLNKFNKTKYFFGKTIEGIFPKLGGEISKAVVGWTFEDIPFERSAVNNSYNDNGCMPYAIK